MMNKTIVGIIFAFLFISAIVIAGPINVDESFAELMTWTGLYGYPSACPAGSAVTQVDDVITCTDSWVNIDGDNMTGDLDVTGNVTADNVFILADIYLHTDTVEAIGTAGLWYNVTFIYNGDAIKHNINHTYNDSTNDTITILYDGIYDFKYAANFNNTNANPDDYAIIRLLINGIEHNGSGMGRHMTKQNAQVPVTSCTSINLTAGDEIKMQYTSTSTDTNLMVQSDLYLEHYDSARLCIKRIR